MNKTKQLKLNTKIKNLPKKPGVYLFKNKQKKIIYIGKALSLKDRVRSYFYQKLADPKTKLMLKFITDVDHQVVSSEFNALLLEAKLVKKYQPKFNSQLKDDKRYLYIAITKAPFRIFPVRQPELEQDLYDWFGPFPSAAAVHQVLRIIRKIFPYCSCRKVPKRQCLYSHIHLCPGFQNLENKEYQEVIKRIRQLLMSKTTFLARSLKKKMLQASKGLKYEEAQIYKNQIVYLDHISQGWRPITDIDNQAHTALLKLRKLLVKYQGISLMTLNKIEGYDVSNLGKDIIVGAMVAFVDGSPEKGLYRKFKVNFKSASSRKRFSFRNQNDPGSIRQIISRRLNHPEWLFPQLVLVDGGKGQITAAFSAIKEKGLASQISVLGLTKKEETIIVPFISNNNITKWHQLKRSPNSPVLKLLQQIRNESHRFAQKYYQELHSAKIKNQ